MASSKSVSDKKYFEIFSEPNFIPILKDSHYNSSYRLKDKPTDKSKYHTRSEEERRFFKFATNRVERNDSGIIIGEIYVSLLCKKLGVPCVGYKYAVNRHKMYEHRGVLSNSFLKKGEKSIAVGQMKLHEALAHLPPDFLFKLRLLYLQMTPLGYYYNSKNINKMLSIILDKDNPKQKRLLGFEKGFIEKFDKELRYLKEQTDVEQSISIDDYVGRINEFAKKNGLRIEDDIRFKLQRMAIIDILTKQFDRHADNISLIYDEKTHTARLAPMYDNGLCGPFCINAPNFDFPQDTTAYIRLEKKDFVQIANPNTAIGCFYQRVKNLREDELDEIIGSIKNIDYDALKRSPFLTKVYGELNERGQDEDSLDALKDNYHAGVRAIDRAIKSVVDTKDFEEENIIRI